jgi:hypothetical protein
MPIEQDEDPIALCGFVGRGGDVAAQPPAKLPPCPRCGCVHGNHECPICTGEEMFTIEATAHADIGASISLGIQMKISECSDCPFCHWLHDSEPTCQHPTTPDEDRFLGSICSFRRPDWCPLLQASITIEAER